MAVMGSNMGAGMKIIRRYFKRRAAAKARPFQQAIADKQGLSRATQARLLGHGIARTTTGK
tara:strand:+ start:151 stop:333 length:183 start_codon:yes stop_codon:yes gene_type:complete